jgi:hypothetical protein
MINLIPVSVSFAEKRKQKLLIGASVSSNNTNFLIDHSLQCKWIRKDISERNEYQKGWIRKNTIYQKGQIIEPISYPYHIIKQILSERFPIFPTQH